MRLLRAANAPTDVVAHDLRSQHAAKPCTVPNAERDAIGERGPNLGAVA